MISSDGVIIRIRACDIRVMGRYSSGVRLMRVNGEDNKVVAFTRAEHDDSAETAEIEQPSEEEIEKDLEESKKEEENEVIEPDLPPEDEE